MAPFGSCKIPVILLTYIFSKIMFGLFQLTKFDLLDLRHAKDPPDYIIKLMEAVYMLLGYEPTWQNAKENVIKPPFINKLVTYDMDKVDVSKNKFGNEKHWSVMYLIPSYQKKVIDSLLLALKAKGRKCRKLNLFQFLIW